MIGHCVSVSQFTQKQQCGTLPTLSQVLKPHNIFQQWRIKRKWVNEVGSAAEVKNNKMGGCEIQGKFRRLVEEIADPVWEC